MDKFDVYEQWLQSARDAQAALERFKAALGAWYCAGKADDLEDFDAALRDLREAGLERWVADNKAGGGVDVSEGVSRDGVRLAGLGVHVRAFAGDGHVLACYIPTARLQMIGGTVLSDPGGDKRVYAVAWERAKAEGARVREYLVGRGFDVRPGVIEIGDARPLAGGWSTGEGGERDDGTAIGLVNQDDSTQRTEGA